MIVASLRTPLTKVARTHVEEEATSARRCVATMQNHRRRAMRPFPSLQAKRGGLANTDAADLLATVLKGVLQQTRIDPKVSRAWWFEGREAG